VAAPIDFLTGAVSAKVFTALSDSR
jgi:hypothetical protein